MGAPLFSGSQIIETETAKVEPHRPKPVPSLNLSEGGTLRSTPYYAPSELRKGILFAFIHGLRDRSFLRRRVKQGWNNATSDVGAPENRIHSPGAPGQSDSPRYLDRWSLPTLLMRIDHKQEVRQRKSSLEMKSGSSSSTKLSLKDFLPNLMKCIA